MRKTRWPRTVAREAEEELELARRDSVVSLDTVTPMHSGLRSQARSAARTPPATPVQRLARILAPENQLLAPDKRTEPAEVGLRAARPRRVKPEVVPGPPAEHPLTRVAARTAGQAQVQLR